MFIEHTTGIWRLVFIENPFTPTSIWLSILTIDAICHKMSLKKTLFMIAQCLPSASDSNAFQQKYGTDALNENNYPKDFLQNCLKPIHLGKPLRTTVQKWILLLFRISIRILKR